MSPGQKLEKGIAVEKERAEGLAARAEAAVAVSYTHLDVYKRQIYGKKIGMTQIFDAQDRIVPVTVIQACLLYTAICV